MVRGRCCQKVVREARCSPRRLGVELGAPRLHAWVTPFGLIIYTVIDATQQTHVSAQVTWDQRVMNARGIIAYFRCNQRDRFCALYNDLRLLDKSVGPLVSYRSSPKHCAFYIWLCGCPYYCLWTTRWRGSEFHSSQDFSLPQAKDSCP